MTDTPKPDPTLSPEAVIDAQLAALEHNDEPHPDAGVEAAYRFASPENKQQTGPLDRFTRLLHNPLYEALLNAKAYHRAPIQVAGNRARQYVTVVTPEGEEVLYLFMLKKQSQGEFEGCWMTNAVVRER